MYNFELIDDENVVKIFDEVFIRQGENEKITSIVLTNKRMLFLEYIVLNEGNEVLRVARGVDYLRKKDVYYQVNLNDIIGIDKLEYYKVTLNNNMVFEFDNDELFSLLSK